jgi:hypothetical protein
VLGHLDPKTGKIEAKQVPTPEQLSLVRRDLASKKVNALLDSRRMFHGGS